MKKKMYFIAAFLFYPGIYLHAGPPDPDTAFSQPISIKYSFSKNLQGSLFKKVVVDYNDVAYVLTDKGVGRLYENEVVKDLLYRPLADKIPVDIATQETAGYLYYLYDSCFLTNGYAGIPYGALPKGKYNKIAVAADGSICLAGDETLALFIHCALIPVPFAGGKIISMQVYKGTFYVLCKDALYRFLQGKPELVHKGSGLQAVSFLKSMIVLGTANGYYGIDNITGDTALSLKTHLPVTDISFLLSVDEKIWAGTPDGAFMQSGAGEFRYYASRRWLDKDIVSGMTADAKGNVYVLTPTGLNEIKFIRNTLARKADSFQKDIRQRHIRYGLLAELRMKMPGDLSTAEMIDTDNDGLWSSFYLGSEAFRYAVTKDPAAKQYVWECFSAYERLISINQLKGFPSRTFERKGYKVSDPDAWRAAPDSGWEWKGTTSSDEFVGYIFIASVIDQFVAKNVTEEKKSCGFYRQNSHAYYR